MTISGCQPRRWTNRLSHRGSRYGRIGAMRAGVGQDAQIQRDNPGSIRSFLYRHGHLHFYPGLWIYWRCLFKRNSSWVSGTSVHLHSTITFTYCNNLNIDYDQETIDKKGTNELMHFSKSSSIVTKIIILFMKMRR